MSTTNRRNILKTIVGSGVLASAAPLSAQHGQVGIGGSPSHAAVAFGQWNTPFDRFPGTFTPANVGHHISPREVTISVFGSVSFLIGGFHLVLIYDNGTEVTDVNTSLVIPGPPVPLINDPNNRIYRGLDPRTQPVDRIEVVHFHEPGRYLVACGVLPHFNDGMYGFVRVVAG